MTATRYAKVYKLHSWAGNANLRVISLRQTRPIHIKISSVNNVTWFVAACRYYVKESAIVVHTALRQELVFIS